MAFATNVAITLRTRASVPCAGVTSGDASAELPNFIISSRASLSSSQWRFGCTNGKRPDMHLYSVTPRQKTSERPSTVVLRSSCSGLINSKVPSGSFNPAKSVNCPVKPCCSGGGAADELLLDVEDRVTFDTAQPRSMILNLKCVADGNISTQMLAGLMSRCTMLIWCMHSRPSRTSFAMATVSLKRRQVTPPVSTWDSVNLGSAVSSSVWTVPSSKYSSMQAHFAGTPLLAFCDAP